VIIPRQPVKRPTQLSPDFDLPDSIDDTLCWLVDVGDTARCV
jgi:hypothetical protein